VNKGATRAEARAGRPRDPTRDQAILAATLGLLGELGYEQVTVRAIAQRAGAGLATLYRRWPTKEDLVVDAVASFKVGDVEPEVGLDPMEALVDHVLTVVELLQGSHSGLIPGIVGQIPHNPALAEALRTKLVLPRLRSVTALLGALPGVDPDRVAEAAELIPSSVFFQIILLGRRLSEADVRRVIDTAVACATPAALRPA
jgi:AcrR family transcriptional regulator